MHIFFPIDRKVIFHAFWGFPMHRKCGFRVFLSIESPSIIFYNLPICTFDDAAKAFSVHDACVARVRGTRCWSRWQEEAVVRSASGVSEHRWGCDCRNTCDPMLQDVIPASGCGCHRVGRRRCGHGACGGYYQRP